MKKDFLPILVFFFPLIMGLSFLRTHDFGFSFIGVLAIDVAFLLLGFVTALIFWRKPLIKVGFRLSTLKKYLVLSSIFGAFTYAIIVYYVVDYFDDSITISSTYIFRELPFPLLFAIFSVAVVPAISEEIMFRGIILEKLNKMAGPLSAIVTSSFLFSIAHLSFFSFFWQIPWAWAIAKMRLKYHTLWYGVIIHFVHNTTVVLLDEFGAGIIKYFN